MYIDKETEIEKIDQLNFRFGMDGGSPAPENPVLMQRDWVYKDKTRVQNINNTVKFMHWNILADKLSQNFDKVPNKYLDWKYRWKMIQQ